MNELSPTQIDISKVPFSKYGSYIALCHNPEKGHLTIHNARRVFGEDHIFTLVFEKDGRPIDYTIEATPSAARIESSSGSARIYLRGDDSVVIECEMIGFELKMVQGKVSWGYEQESYPTNYGIQEAERRFKMIRVDSRLYCAIDVLSGSAVAEGPFDKSPNGQERNCRTWLRVEPEGGKALVNIEISPLESKPHPITLDVDSDIANVNKEWNMFLVKMPAVPKDRQSIAEMTWYNLWSSVVRAEDCYHYDAMLMSKNYMCSVWTWDHCFNALAVATADLRMAIEHVYNFAAFTIPVGKLVQRNFAQTNSGIAGIEHIGNIIFDDHTWPTYPSIVKLFGTDTQPRQGRIAWIVLPTHQIFGTGQADCIPPAMHCGTGGSPLIAAFIPYIPGVP